MSMGKENFIKITNTVYRILDFLPDSDPLKNRAKEKVLAILENLTLVSGAVGWISLQKEKASAQLLDDIEILENYLKVGRHQGWIDNMNFLIITKEYHQIKSGIKFPKGIVRESLEIANKIPLPKISDSLIKGDTKLINKNLPLSVDQKQDNVEVEKDNIKTTGIEKYSQRQGKILEILDKKEKAQVSDFIKDLPNVTKRTVRRDLDDLLKRGKIMRIGDWNQVFYKKIDRTSIPVVKMS